MKGIIRKLSPKPIPSSETILAIECLILGITYGSYYVLDESNYVKLLPKEWVEITDYEQPDFWINVHDEVLLPEEWLSENYMLLYDCDILDEWDEIWITTQFAKGLSRFNLPTVPLNYKNAFDSEYKVGLVSNYLRLACDYDNLVERYGTWVYTFGYFDNNVDFFRVINGEPQYFTKKPLSGQATGFEVLMEILKQIGRPFEDYKLRFDSEKLEVIRNRVLFSIWSLFATKQFDVYQLIYERYGRGDYVVQLNDQYYLLSFDYCT